MALFKKREDDLIRLATFENPIEAHTMRVLLESHGIAASISGEESAATFGVLGLGSSGLVGVQVLVKRSELEEAKLIVMEVPAASDILIPEWDCQCGEIVDQGFAVCWSCGEEYPDDKPQFPGEG